jgi:hypothetical protein
MDLVLAVEGSIFSYSYSNVKGLYYFLLVAATTFRSEYVMVSGPTFGAGSRFLQHLIFRLLAPDSVMLNGYFRDV